MNVTFRCPHCDQIGRVEFDAATRELACPHCAARWLVPSAALAEGKLWQCLVCPSTELFIRKDFSQKLGVTIVVVGFVISSVFWFYRMPLWTYGVLFGTALIDVVLYFAVGNVLHCYRCQAQYRGVPGLANHGGFDLETHEKHRQQKIRLAEAACQNSKSE
jgi:DNA-directed RNA polymerase subunit RPC12/RpoP